MANGKKDLRKQLREYKFQFGLMQKTPCNGLDNKTYRDMVKNGEKLPENVFPYIYDDGSESETEFYIVYEPDLTEAEIAEYLTYKKLEMIRTIKNCAVFFTTLAVIGMVAYILLSFMAM